MAVHVIEPTATMTISTEEWAFFTALGERIALLRRVNCVTQVQVAEALGVSQQTLPSYELGRRRIPVSALPVAESTHRCRSMSCSARGTRPRAAKRGPVPQWQRQMEAIAQLPKARQRFVSEMLQRVLAQAASH